MPVRLGITAVPFRILRFERRKKLAHEVPEQLVKREVSLTQKQQHPDQQHVLSIIETEILFKLNQRTYLEIFDVENEREGGTRR